jgi:hypothetical protein
LGEKRLSSVKVLEHQRQHNDLNWQGSHVPRDGERQQAIIPPMDGANTLAILVLIPVLCGSGHNKGGRAAAQVCQYDRE